MKKGLIATIIFVAIHISTYGQDPQFSQFYTNNLYLAPSFAGLVEDTRLNLNYRQQWKNISNGFNTYSVSLDHNFETFNSGVGLYIMKDMAGTGQLTGTMLGLQYSYDFKLNKYWHVRPGLEFLYEERSIDFSRLLWHDQMSARGNAPTSAESFPIDKVGNIDFSTSVMTYSDIFWGGVSVDHILEPSLSLYNIDSKDKSNGYIPMKISIFGGLKVVKRGMLIKPKDNSLQLAFLYKKQEDYEQLDMGFYWFKKPVVIGVWYRGLTDFKPKFTLNNDALILLLALKTDYVTCGYSYDFTISPLIRSTGGAHEISIAYRFKTLKIKKKPRMVPCPEF